MTLQDVKYRKDMTLFEKACCAVLGTRFEILEYRLGHTPTDQEVAAEAEYQLEDLPCKGLFDLDEEDEYIQYCECERELKWLIKEGRTAKKERGK